MSKDENNRINSTLPSFINISALIALGLLLFFIYIFFYHSENDNEALKPFCGTTASQNVLYSQGTVNYESGKKLFKMNCAPCHHRNMLDDLLGPALHNTFILWNHDTTAYINYLNDSQKFFKSTDDRRLIKLKSEYGIEYSHKNSFSKEEISMILEYINSFSSTSK